MAPKVFIKKIDEQQFLTIEEDEVAVLQEEAKKLWNLYSG